MKVGSINEVSGGSFELVDVDLVFLGCAVEGEVEAFSVLPDVDDALQSETLDFRMKGNRASQCLVQLWHGVIADIDPTDLSHCRFSVKVNEYKVRCVLDPGI